MLPCFVLDFVTTTGSSQIVMRIVREERAGCREPRRPRELHLRTIGSRCVVRPVTPFFAFRSQAVSESKWSLKYRRHLCELLAQVDLTLEVRLDIGRVVNAQTDVEWEEAIDHKA